MSERLSNIEAAIMFAENYGLSRFIAAKAVAEEKLRVDLLAFVRRVAEDEVGVCDATLLSDAAELVRRAEEQGNG